MKVAFDENIPPVMVTVFQTLAKNEGVLGVEVVTAADYKPRSERGDQHWVKRFAAVGGRVIISGDTKMHGRLHEIAALSEAGLITYFFGRRWSDTHFFSKCAMLLHWWPKIHEHMATAAKGTCWQIPAQWNWKEFRNVTVDPKEISAKKNKRSG